RGVTREGRAKAPEWPSSTYKSLSHGLSGSLTTVKTFNKFGAWRVVRRLPVIAAFFGGSDRWRRGTLRYTGSPFRAVPYFHGCKWRGLLSSCHFPRSRYKRFPTLPQSG